MVYVNPLIQVNSYTITVMSTIGTRRVYWEHVLDGDVQNTDPQSMDYPYGLPKWTTLKWTTPENNIPNEYFLMFLAAGILRLHI